MKFMELHPWDAIPDARTIWYLKQALQRVEQPGIQHGSVCVLDEVKLEREATQSSEMVDRRENGASSNQMKADGREIDRTSGPFRTGFKKILPIRSVH